MSGNDLPLWEFSLAVYANPEVRKECLDLQDRYGLDVNLLLFCAFVGAHHGAQLSNQAIDEAAELVKIWHDRIVVNVRETRRALKTFATGTLPSSLPLACLRDDVKALEIEAERFEQLMLETWAESRIAQWLRTQPRAAILHTIRTLFATSCKSPSGPGLPQHLVEAAVRLAFSAPEEPKSINNASLSGVDKAQ
jgi:uncharacterized protein (TIGR02444 family)